MYQAKPTACAITNKMINKATGNINTHKSVKSMEAMNMADGIALSGLAMFLICATGPTRKKVEVRHNKLPKV